MRAGVRLQNDVGLNDPWERFQGSFLLIFRAQNTSVRLKCE